MKMVDIALIDGKNFVFRNHFTHRTLATSAGEPTSVLFGCLRGLLGLAKRLPDTALVFVWDGGGTTWRHALLSGETQHFEKKPAPIKISDNNWLTQQVNASLNFMSGGKKAAPVGEVVREIKGYKGGRVEFDVKHKEYADDKAKAGAQIPELQRILRRLNFTQFKINELEADDMIGILATSILEKDLFEKVIIVSSDKDFYQLMSDRVKISLGNENGIHDYMQARDVLDKHGVGPENWLKFRALCGDASDSIPPAVPGLGPKTAINLLAAGVDPSVKDYRDLGYNVRLKMGDMKIRGIGIVNWVQVWPVIRRNYTLCKIMLDHRDGRISDNKRQEIYELTRDLRREDFLRKRPGEGVFREFSEWLVKNEMEHLFGRRQEFWEIGINTKGEENDNDESRGSKEVSAGGR